MTNVIDYAYIATNTTYDDLKAARKVLLDMASAAYVIDSNARRTQDESYKLRAAGIVAGLESTLVTINLAIANKPDKEALADKV